jgi:[CysO sulfur-carrier protein]-S-L-cysteine hydrolase
MTNIKLPYEIKNNIGNHALREYPKECCGFLIGYIKDNLMICVTIKKVNNIASNPYNFFEIDPQEIINTQKQYRNNKLSILGHYHSHPNSLLNSRPSKKDIDSIYDFNLCWVIVGINDNEVNYSAYIPKFTIRNTYNFKKINII